MLPLALAFYYSCSLPIVHSDFFYNLMNGRLIVEQRALSDRDVLAYAPLRTPFYNQPWLTQLLYYVEFSFGGYPLVLFVHACAVTAAFALLFLRVRDLTRSTRWASGTTLFGVAMAMTNLSVRPQAYSFLPFALILLLLSRYSKRGWQLFLIPVVMAAWVNIHGAFLLGLGLVAIYLLGASLEELGPWRGPAGVVRSPVVRRLASLLVLTFGAMLLNPYGIHILDYWFTATNDPVARTLDVEWQPTSLSGVIGTTFFISLVPLLAVVTLTRRRFGWTDGLLLLAFGFFALVSVRNVVWWAFIMPPILANQVAALLPSQTTTLPASREIPVLNAVLLGVLALVVLAGLPWFRATNPLLAPGLRTYLDAKHPTGVVEYFRRSGASGRIFSRYEWGGYLEWELWPRMQPLVDARIEIRPVEVWVDYFSILGAQSGWQVTLDRYHPDYVVLERGTFPALEQSIAGSSTWREVYRDSLAAVYARA